MTTSKGEPPQSPEIELAKVVVDLTLAVRALDSLLRGEYPKRSEIERRFLSKQESTRRIRLVLYATLIPILVAFVVSFFFTTAVVSSCFLSKNDPPSACNVIPSFKDSVKRNKELVKEFARIQRVTDINDKRISKLERQANK